MKTIALQLVTVGLENGQRGVFIGVPLITENSANADNLVEDIWFSNIQEVPDHLTVANLIRLVREESYRRQAKLH